jgi:hypothetical protein
MDDPKNSPPQRPTAAEVQNAADKAIGEIDERLRRARSERRRARAIRRKLSSPDRDPDQ